MKRNASLSVLLKPIEEQNTQALLSNAVQVADILEWILSQVGEADVWQTSFSISEEFLRRIFFIAKAKKIKSVTIVLDHKATNKTLRLWPFLSQVVDNTYLADNHSKILLVKGLRGGVAVITSQNLTRGNRAESYIITADKQVFDTLLAQVNDLINFHSVPFNDLYQRRINAD